MPMILIVLLSFSLVAGHPCEQSFSQGVQAYQQENYESAVEYWQECAASGGHFAELYYNLGNAFYRQGELGQAIRYYMSARRLNPTDKDMAANLRFAEQSTIDQVEMVGEENPVLKGIWLAHHLLNLNIQAKVLIALAWLWVLLWILLWTSKSSKMRTIYNVVIIAVPLFAALLALSMGAKIWEEQNHSSAVVISREADVMSGPGKRFQVLNEVHEGTVVEVREVNGDWISVRLGEQIAGFIAAEDLGMVK